jgi:hypothetical protein
MPPAEGLETKSNSETLGLTPANDLNSPKNVPDDNMIVVDWDGPADLENPKMYVEYDFLKMRFFLLMFLFSW